MKSNKIYLIKILSEPNDKETQIMLAEVAACFEPEDEGNFVVEDVNGLDYIFLRFEDYKVDKICKVLDKYIRYEVEEIGDKLILGNEAEFKDILKNDEFKKLFDSFRIDNTKVDDVLDKINYKGIDSLDDIDKKILSRG
jgi:hypothetical protein